MYNCRIPIRVIARDLGTGDPGVALNYDIVPTGEGLPELLPGAESGKSSTRPHATPPRGYSFHVGSPVTIQPGADQLFSIPGTICFLPGYLQVSFSLVLPKNLSGRQPSSLVDFTWGDIPSEFRRGAGGAP